MPSISTFSYYISICLTACLFCGCQPTSETSIASAQDAEEAMQSHPTIPDYSVWRPFFFTEYGNQAIDEIRGTAFAVKVEPGSKTFLLTALHLLGPEGGLTQQIEPGQIRESVNEVVISDAFGATDSTFTLKLPFEPPLDLNDKEYWRELDVLMLSTQGSKGRFQGLEMATENPKTGDLIWLSTAVFGGAPASQSTHEATIVDIDDAGRLRYEFKNPRLKLDAADGAPLVDAAGHVVGMHLKQLNSESTASGDSNVAQTPKSGSASVAVVQGRGVAVEKLVEAIQQLVPAAVGK